MHVNYALKFLLQWWIQGGKGDGCRRIHPPPPSLLKPKSTFLPQHPFSMQYKLWKSSRLLRLNSTPSPKKYVEEQLQTWHHDIIFKIVISALFDIDWWTGLDLHWGNCLHSPVRCLGVPWKRSHRHFNLIMDQSALHLGKNCSPVK